MNEQAIFVEALQKSDPIQRDQYLQQVCGGDQILRNRVEALLAAYEQAGSFMDHPAAVMRATLEPESEERSGAANGTLSTTEPPAASEGPGAVIGHYKLLEQLGEGGMGTVYMAEQTEPVRRKVALKIIKPGMDTRRVIGRFQAERQALALMDHPHIAKVLDAGSTDSGRPYFVMELVKGVPITQYCDQQRLTLPERLALFNNVCQALQHAHQKGIIHRDIKPSNVLVATYDGRPVVKVIDFGVAKAMGQQLTEQTFFTGFGAIVGTLEYMSPEQAEFNALDVDTRSDVYSLGVLLYEILTGTTPLCRQRLKQAALTELLRVIREDEPPKPSTRLSDSQEALSSISAVRRVEPARMARLVRGELDWIVMKALEKDRNRRYETALALSRDIEHYLNNEAVEACPPSAGYKMRKLARRHKAALVTVMAFLGLLIAAAVISAGMAFRAIRAERIARVRFSETQVALQLSEQSRKQAEAVAEFLVETFRGPDPTHSGMDANLSELLGRAAERLESRFHDDPVIRSSLLDAIGQTYTGLSPSQDAVRLLKQAHRQRLEEFGEEDPRTIRTLGHLAFATYLAGDVEEAIRLGEAAVCLGRDAWAVHDPDSALPKLLIHLSECYTAAAHPEDEIEQLCQEAFDITQAVPGGGHPDNALAMWNLARVHADAGRYQRALELAEPAVKMLESTEGDDHPNTIRAALVVGHARFAQSQQWSESILYFEELLQRTRDRFGDEHHAVHEITLSYVAPCYLHSKQHHQVVELVEPALEEYAAAQGSDHFVVIQGHVVLARAYTHLGQFADAVQAGRQALVRVKAQFGPHHAKTRRVADELFRLGYASATDTFSGEQSLELAKPALELAEELFGTEHFVTVLATLTLAGCYHETTLYEEAEAVMKQAVRRTRETPPEKPEFLVTAVAWLGMNQLYLGKYQDAQPLLEEVLRSRQETMPDHWLTYQAKSLLGECLTGQRQWQLAEKHLLEGYAGMKARSQHIPETQRAERLNQAAQSLVRFYQARGGDGDVEQAERWIAELQLETE